MNDDLVLQLTDSVTRLLDLVNRLTKENEEWRQLAKDAVKALVKAQEAHRRTLDLL